MAIEKDPTQRIKEIREKHEQRLKSQQAAEPSPAPIPEPYQLPIWPNRVRSLPNAFARGALFTVGNHRAPRRQFKKEPIATVANIVVLFSGEELRQDDEDVFLQCLHLAREKAVMFDEPTVEFTAGAAIKQLGWAHNKRSYERLKASLERMKQTTVEVKIENKRGFLGSLVRKAFWEELDGSQSRRWKVWFEPEIARLFGPDDYSQIQWDLRLSLTPMEKWLHSFYATHEKPYPYSVTLLRSLCGAATSDLRGFRRTLKSALCTLVERRFLKDFSIDSCSDLVHVTRAPVGNDTRLLGR